MDRARQNRLLLALAWVLVAGAIAVLLIRRLPVFVRIEGAGIDLVAAASLWLYRRQNPG